MRSPALFDLDFGVGLDGAAPAPSQSCRLNGHSFESLVMESLNTALATLKSEFLQELHSLLESWNYDEHLRPFLSQLHMDIRSLFLPAPVPSGVPIMQFDDELTLPPRSVVGFLTSDSLEIEVELVRQQFCESASTLLRQLAKGHEESATSNEISRKPLDRAQTRLNRKQFEIEAGEIQRTIEKEMLHSRLQRLRSERVVFHDRLSEFSVLSEPPERFPEMALEDLRRLVAESHGRNLTRKSKAVSAAVQSTATEIQFLTHRLLLATDVISQCREKPLASSSMGPPRQEGAVLFAVKAKLKALQYERNRWDQPNRCP
jgi:hypothetical protein